MIRCINLTAQLLNPLIRFFESFHGGKLIYLALSCQLIRLNDHPRKPVANPGEGPRGPGGPGSPLVLDQPEARRVEKIFFEKKKTKTFTDSLSERVNWVHCMSLIGFAD